MRVAVMRVQILGQMLQCLIAVAETAVVDIMVVTLGAAIAVTLVVVGAVVAVMVDSNRMMVKRALKAETGRAVQYLLVVHNV